MNRNPNRTREEIEADAALEIWEKLRPATPPSPVYRDAERNVWEEKGEFIERGVEELH